MRLVHVITGLDAAGTEISLYRLLAAAPTLREESAVVALGGAGPIGHQLTALGVPVHCLGMAPGKPTLRGGLRLLGIVRELRPALLHGWLYHGNLAAQLAAFAHRARVRVMWSIRQAIPSLREEKLGTRVVIGLLRRLSGHPARIVYNSVVSAAQHTALGFRSDRNVIIPNGFDTRLFRPTGRARLAVRGELGLRDDAILVGQVGRFHRHKDPCCFLQAAALLRARLPDVHFLMAGRGIEPSNPDLWREVQRLGLVDRVSLLGEREDIAQLTGALDIATSSSVIEGLSNAIGEAMSCAVPCVVTDVGDSAALVGETGRVVPPRSPLALSAACYELARLGRDGRRRLGAAARRRIVEKFSLATMADAYQALYREVCAEE